MKNAQTMSVHTGYDYKAAGSKVGQCYISRAFFSSLKQPVDRSDPRLNFNYNILKLNVPFINCQAHVNLQFWSFLNIFRTAIKSHFQ
jgi:hypothetical protein